MGPSNFCDMWHIQPSHANGHPIVKHHHRLLSIVRCYAIFVAMTTAKHRTGMGSESIAFCCFPDRQSCSACIRHSVDQANTFSRFLSFFTHHSALQAKQPTNQKPPCCRNSAEVDQSQASIHSESSCGEEAIAVCRRFVRWLKSET